MTVDPDILAAVGDIDRAPNLGVTPYEVLRLAEATPQDQIRTRPGLHSKNCDKPCNVAHKPLSYVDARFVMRRLDEVIGPEYWQSKHTMVGDKVQCSIGIKIDGEWVWKSDGAGETDIEGEKGSFSDALKRAAVSWGIARDLYPEPSSSGAGRAAPSARPPAAPLATRPSVDDNEYDPGADDDDGPPFCPVHRVPMIVSKYADKQTGRFGWYCREKAQQGQPANARGYCNQQVAG